MTNKEIWKRAHNRYNTWPWKPGDIVFPRPESELSVINTAAKKGYKAKVVELEYRESHGCYYIFVDWIDWEMDEYPAHQHCRHRSGGWYPDDFYQEDKVDFQEFNSNCPICGSPAFNLVFAIRCSNQSCQNGR